MKKGLTTSLLLLGSLAPAWAGGVFYNSNQSAEYFRSFDRNSATDNADIVYYNMAGTVNLPEGWTFNASNQTIFQWATVRTKGNPVLGDKEYKSDNPAWTVPNFYLNHRKGDRSLFLGLETIGATAIREWKDGLPTLDLLGKQGAGYGGASSGVIAGDAYTAAILSGKTPTQAQAAAVAAGLDASPYTSKSYLKGSSYYLALRGGGAWRLNRFVSVAGALRFVTARQDIVGRIDYANTYNNTTFNHDLRSQGSALIDTSAKANGLSGELAIDVYPTDRTVLSLTYEQATHLEFKTTVRDGKDGNGQFKDGSKAHLDLPQAIRFGVGHQVTPRLRLSAGVNVYLEGTVDFSMLDNPSTGADHKKDYRNTTEESASVEYRLNPRWLWSAGINLNQIGQRKESTIDTSIPGAHGNYESLGTGVQYQPSAKTKINLGVGWTQFTQPYENRDAGDRQLKSSFAAQGVAIDPRKEYDKRYLIVAIGIDYRF